MEKLPSLRPERNQRAAKEVNPDPTGILDHKSEKGFLNGAMAGVRFSMKRMKSGENINTQYGVNFEAHNPPSFGTEYYCWIEVHFVIYQIAMPSFPFQKSN